jgi:hypothetical protein
VGNDVAIEELELCFDDVVWLEEPSKPSRSRTKTEGA